LPAKRNLNLTVRTRGKGNPIAVTAPGRDLIERLAANGASIETIAAALGISGSTLNEAAKRDPAVQEALDKGHGALETELVGLLMKAAREGDKIAAIFLLKGKRHWRDSTPVEPKGDTPNITINLPGAASPEDYRRMIDVTPSRKEATNG
jgi:hypothetical protein